MGSGTKQVVFVAGTGAGIGQTTLSAALVRRLRAMGIRAIGVKPVETGCAHGEDQDLVGADGALLHRASQRAAPPLAVAPYRFVPRVAPALAAELAGLELGGEELAQAVEAVFDFGTLAVVDAPGGALAPLAKDTLGLDLAERLGAVLLIVAADDAEATGQVLLILEAARRRALRIAGVALTRPAAGIGRDALQNTRLIRERGGVTVFPTVPHTPGEEKDLLLAVEGHLTDHRIAEQLLTALDHP